MPRQNTVRKFAELDKDDVDWFKSTYPGASLSWILAMLLTKFREAHTSRPEDFAKIGAQELKRILEENP